jgi:hypothetical protein
MCFGGRYLPGGEKLGLWKSGYRIIDHISTASTATASMDHFGDKLIETQEFAGYVAFLIKIFTINIE